MKKRVLIISRYLPHYRKDFFEGLKLDLEHPSLIFEYIYGTPDPKEELKNDWVDISWGKKIKNKYFKLPNGFLCWQPCIKDILKSQFIIVPQANRNLINYFLVFLNVLKIKKVAFWGHGKNMQETDSYFAKNLKKILTNKVYWWFAYTELSKTIVKNSSFDESRITVVNNSIKNNINFDFVDSDRKNVEVKYGILFNKYTCVFVGGIYDLKRIDFLISAARSIHEQLSEFNLIIIGGGSGEKDLQKKVSSLSYISYLGPIFSNDKNIILNYSSLLLMPGLVGLVILDSFLSRTPIVTTDISYHSPEISYLENGINGIMTNDDLDTYSKTVVDLLKNSNRIGELERGCLNSSKNYTLGKMISNFSTGIINALNL